MSSRRGFAGRACFLKTSGGKGMHVLVSLERRHVWDEVKDFAHAITRHLAKQMPDRFSAGRRTASVGNIDERLALEDKDDPWAGWGDGRQRLTRRMWELLGEER